MLNSDVRHRGLGGALTPPKPNKSQKRLFPPELDALIRDENAAREYLLSFCWPTGTKSCPRCATEKLYTITGNRYRCSSCKYTFQDFSGRWINNSGLSYSDWLSTIRAFFLEHSVQKIAEDLGLTYNTAYKAMTALRFAILAREVDAKQLLSPATGLDTNIKGAKLKTISKHECSRILPVYGIMNKKGWVFVDLLPNIQAETIFHFHLSFHLKLARSGHLVHTSRYKDYDTLLFCGDNSLPYDCVRRYEQEVDIDASDDRFWSYAHKRLKAFRGVTSQRFPLYIKELAFRYNNRNRDIFAILLRRLCSLVPKLD